jgi:hypothetical protein
MSGAIAGRTVQADGLRETFCVPAAHFVPVLLVELERALGPAALPQAYRWLAD